MKVLHRFVGLVLMIPFCLQSSGCYMSKGLVPPTQDFIQLAGAQQSLPASAQLSINLTHSFEDQVNEAGWAQDARIQEATEASLKIFKEAHLFRSVGYDETNPNLKIKLDIKEVEKGSSESAFLAGFTLFLWPVKTGLDIDVTAKVSDSQGNLLQEYHSKGDANVIMHLIFIIPFGWRFGVFRQVYEEVFKDIALQISQDREKYAVIFGTP